MPDQAYRISFRRCSPGGDGLSACCKSAPLVRNYTEMKPTPGVGLRMSEAGTPRTVKEALADLPGSTPAAGKGRRSTRTLMLPLINRADGSRRCVGVRPRCSGSSPCCAEVSPEFLYTTARHPT